MVTQITKPKTKRKEVWQVYLVLLKFTSRLMAGIPANPEVIKTWLESKGIADPNLEEEIETAVDASAEMDKSRLVFCKDKEGLYVPGYYLKAHLKNCANIAKDFIGIKAFRSKVADRVQVFQQNLYLWRKDKVLREPDGTWEHPVHVETRMGPRSALKANDFINPPCEIRAQIKVLNDGVITQEDLEVLFQYGGEHGFGAERGLQFGRYIFQFGEMPDKRII